MGFKELYLYNFRNFKNLKINLDFPEIYFVGKNGQGKTNILESLYYLCYGSSFRTKNDSIILKHNENQMAAAAKFEKSDYSLNKISIQFDKGIKKIKCNDSNITDRREILFNMPCIVFCHGDLDFVVGSPEKKRIFFDQTLSLLDNDYVEILVKYKKILKNRNKILKSNANDILLSTYTEKLVDYGLLLQIKRMEIISDFNSIVSKLFNKISDLPGEIKIEYLSSWKNNDRTDILNYVKSKFSYEMKMKTSCYGPHRDNFKFIYDKMDFNQFASTGQLRLLSLILRAAQGNFYLEKTGKKPILLLDDVLLELDNEKREKFMNNLPPFEQAFYTFLPDSSALKNNDAKIFYVENGEIKIEKSR